MRAVTTCDIWFASLSLSTFILHRYMLTWCFSTISYEQQSRFVYSSKLVIQKLNRRLRSSFRSLSPRLVAALIVMSYST